MEPLRVSGVSQVMRAPIPPPPRPRYLPPPSPSALLRPKARVLSHATRLCCTPIFSGNVSASRALNVRFAA